MPDIVKIILPIALVAVIALLFFLGYLKAPPDTADRKSTRLNSSHI